MCSYSESLNLIVNECLSFVYSAGCWRLFLSVHLCRLISNTCLNITFLSIVVLCWLVINYVQFILFVLCHPSWAVRRAAYNSVKKIIAAIPQLSEAIMLEFSNYLSAVGEKVLLRTRWVPAVQCHLLVANLVTITIWWVWSKRIT